MRGRVVTMVGIAAVFGAISVFAADMWLKNQASARVAEAPVAAPAAPAIEFGTIVVAVQPLRYGMMLDRAQLGEIPWPQETLPAGAFAKIDRLLSEGGRVVLSPMEVNEPVLASKLSGPDGKATLSNMLAPGMRAVAIKTDEIAGVGGFITPGDRVDIVLTPDAGDIAEVERAAKGAAGSTLTSEIVLDNVKVLTVGQGADERRVDPQVVSSVTVEVTVEGAQKIALARSIGQLSLSLRSPIEMTGAEAGMTTIGAFGGSLRDGVSMAVDAVVKSVEGSGPKRTTVVVTRGLETESYTVVSPSE